MSEFKLEERFIVVKLKDLPDVSPSADPALAEKLLRKFLWDWGIQTRECVVVESDWPEYETVLAMLAARVEGLPTPYQVLEQQVTALRQHKNDYMEAADETYRAFQSEIREREEEIARLDALVLERTAERDSIKARIAELEDREPVIYWVLYDATADQKFIKKMLPEGFLGFFDNEQEAQRAKNNNPGTDFKRVEYYKAPVAQAGQVPDEVRHWSDCATNNRGCPELLGPCDCGGYKEGDA